MKSAKIKELFQKRAVKAGSLALAVMIAAGSLWSVNQQSTVVPELVTFVDTEENVVIGEEEVPLAAPKVTKSTKTTKKTKKIKMKKASKKTYTKAGKSTKKTKTKKSSTKKSSTTTRTETQTKVTNQYKKGSKINTQVTTVKTTVTKTVVAKQSAAAPAATSAPEVQEERTMQEQVSGAVSLNTAAPKLNSRVAQAFEKLHFTIEVNASVSYSGKFSARSQNVVLKRMNDTVYHELGHFAAFAAGNADLTAEWKNVYNNEKSLYTGSNKAYVLSTASEYFAESFKDYTLNPAALQAARPQTYAAIEAAVAKITDAQINTIWNTYKPIWN